ncbi:MAG: hypothetical protein LPK80_11860 [Bacteroidota bacterium]|nr:hypothetical protein [Bacteroidota bacterium]
MELGTAIIGLIVLTATFLPFVIIHRNKGKKDHESLVQLTRIAFANRSDIAQWDKVMNLSLGISSDNRYLFYVRKEGDQWTERWVELENIETCQSNTIRRPVQGKAEKDSVIERLELVLAPINRSGNIIRLEIFDAQKSLQIYEEYNLLKKWEGLIQNALSMHQMGDQLSQKEEGFAYPV